MAWLLQNCLQGGEGILSSTFPTGATSRCKNRPDLEERDRIIRDGHPQKAD
ncbi:MAG: hypothetical protein ACYCOO_03470 [Chitinophagaceae bacterium]